jgi:mannose-1-phosphate guanylyltransferase
MTYAWPCDEDMVEKAAAFLQTSASRKHLWSIILAGGNGDRMSELIYSWIGRPVPKQYCAFTGTRSMLQHTLLRADKLSQREHQLILIAEAHEADARTQLADRWPNGIIAQPANRDTLPGIFLPLTHVYARDTKATVAILPSDHFIYPEQNFRDLVEHAIQAVEEMPDMIMLLGVPAAYTELEYGWICPGSQIWKSGKHSARAVNLFLEKPSHAKAAVAMESGGLWNTMIVVAKVDTLWQLGCEYFPEVMKHFIRLHRVIGTSQEEDVLKAIYEVMPARNFSSDLLTQVIGRVGVMPMRDILWCDWGRKERILETLQFLGRRPNFPMVPAIGPGKQNSMKEWRRPLLLSNLRQSNCSSS